MNATTLEAPVRTSGAARSRVGTAPVPTKVPSRPRRRTGRGTGPVARPARPLPSSLLSPAPGLRPQSCRVAPPVVAPLEVGRPSSWRLTERGIALVLVTGLLIVTAALAVVGLTAMRVTGEHYAGVGHSALVQP